MEASWRSLSPSVQCPLVSQSTYKTHSITSRSNYSQIINLMTLKDSSYTYLIEEKSGNYLTEMSLFSWIVHRIRTAVYCTAIVRATQGRCSRLLLLHLSLVLLNHELFKSLMSQLLLLSLLNVGSGGCGGGFTKACITRCR